MTAKLTFGYLYDFRNPPQWHRRWAELYAETLDFVALTEQLGFDGAWLPEHHGADDGYLPSPLMALAAIAARTSERSFRRSAERGQRRATGRRAPHARCATA